MATINRSYIQSLLRPGLYSVFGNYDVYPDLWKEIYSQHVSDKAVEYIVEIQGLGLAQLKPEGNPVALSDMKQFQESSFVNQTYGIGFVITREALRDNQYPDQFPQQALNLRNSLSTVKNTNGAAVFNNAFNSLSTGADGQPLASTQHPTAVGTLANTFTDNPGLNESSLEDAITIIKGWTNAAGLRINTNALKLLVPQAGAFQASRLLNSQYRMDTGDNTISAIVHDKYIPGGFIANQFILNPKFWGVLTDEPNGFMYFSKEKLDVDFLTDSNTDNVTVRAIERYSFGYANWRGGFFALGA
jgi:hypothetical protein